MSNWQIFCFIIWAMGTASIALMGMFGVKWPADKKCHLDCPYCIAAGITMTAWITMWFV